MLLLLFNGIDAEGKHHKCSLGGLTLEICLEGLMALVRNGWQIQAVKLLDGKNSPTTLPVEAFDGAPVGQVMNELEREWTSLLTVDKL